VCQDQETQLRRISVVFVVGTVNRVWTAEELYLVQQCWIPVESVAVLEAAAAVEVSRTSAGSAMDRIAVSAVMVLLTRTW